jgi:hypothetical protein
VTQRRDEIPEPGFVVNVLRVVSIRGRMTEGRYQNELLK